MGYYTCWVVERPIDGKYVQLARGTEKAGYEITDLFHIDPTDQVLKNTWRKNVPDSTESYLHDPDFIAGPWVLDWAQAMWLLTKGAVEKNERLTDDIQKMVEAKGDRLIIWGDP